LTHGYNAGFEDEPINDIPNQAIDKAIVSSLKLQQQGYEKAQSLTKKIEASHKDYVKELRAVVTQPKWSKWTKTRLKHRTGLRDAITKAEPTYEGEKQIQKKKKEIIAYGEKLRRDISLNITRATQLRDQHSNRLDKAIEKAWEIPARPTFLLAIWIG
jgi:rubrerythrin